jgi:hypothetical protein
MKHKFRGYEEGGEVDPLEEANKGENLDTTPGPKAEREVEKPKPKPRAKASPPASKPVAKAAAPSPAPAKAKSGEYTGLPTAAERVSEIRKRLSEAEAENVRKRNERAEESKKSLSGFMRGLKRRFGTQAMREEASQGYAKGGSVRGGGCEQRGHTKGTMR